MSEKMAMHRIFFILFMAFFTDGFSESVSFEKALGMDILGRKFLCKKEQDNTRYEACSKAFDCQDADLHEIRIPQKIHFVWLNSKPLPKKNLSFVQSFKHKHPGFEIKIWTKEDLVLVPSEFQALIEQRKTLREKEDILRCGILLEHGGFVVDVEHESLRPLGDLCRRSSFIASLEPPLAKRKFKRRLHYTTLFVGASKAHPIVKCWLLEIIAAYGSGAHQDKSIDKSLRKEKFQLWTPCLLFAKVVDDALCENVHDALVLPPTYVFPIRALWMKAYEKQEKNAVLEKVFTCFQTSGPPFSQLAPESVCVHHKGGSWER